MQKLSSAFKSFTVGIMGGGEGAGFKCWRGKIRTNPDLTLHDVQKVGPEKQRINYAKIPEPVEASILVESRWIGF